MKRDLSKIKSIVVTHVLTSQPDGGFGPDGAIADFLRNSAENLLYIRHSLEGTGSTRTAFFVRGKVAEETKGGRSGLPTVINFAKDIITTISRVRKLKMKFDVFIGVNCLNALTGLILRRMKIVRYVIFYTADYVPSRFKNPVLNRTYHLMDRICVHRADYIWGISPNMVEIRRAQGISSEKNIYVPHGADLSKIEHCPQSQIMRRSLVVGGHITKSIDFGLVIDALAEVVKEVAGASLIIIGTGPEEDSLKSYVREKKLEKHVRFTGWMKHDDLLKFYTRCGVGLAIYSSCHSWTQFGDSLKAKEYLACGLPVIMSGAPASAQAVQQSNAVIVIEQDKNALVDSILKLLTNDKLYESYRENAKGFAETLDWNNIFGNALRDIVAGNRRR